MRSLVITLCAVAACASAPRPTPTDSSRLASVHSASAPLPASPPLRQGGGVASERALTVVRASHPIQFPRSYWVDRQLWTVFSTLAQDSMEAHVARTNLAQRAVVRTELLTPSNHAMSAFASLAQSPERIAIAYDDDGYGERMSRFTMFARPNDAPLQQPWIEAGMWANTTSASIAYSPALREWATFSASDGHVWSVRLRADGTLIAGSGLRLSGLRYDRRCGERFLWNGSAWIALAHRDDGTFVFVERDGQRDRARPLGLRAQGAVSDAAIAFHNGRYAIAWVDDEGAKASIVFDEQQFTRPQPLANANRHPGVPVVAHDGQRFVVVWTETDRLTAIYRASIADNGVLSEPELFASDPIEHVWWPHITPSDGPRPAVFTFQVGQSEARVWTER